jgi:SAM-dependent methyltransferase
MRNEKEQEYQWRVDAPRGYANAMGHYKTQSEGAFLKKHLRCEHSRILDIGGGAGRFAIPLANEGHRLTVVDICQEALTILGRRTCPNIALVCDDFYSWDVSGTFDAAIAIESIPSFTGVKLASLFGKVRALLRPEAPFIFTALNRQSWRFRLSALRNGSEPGFNVTNPAGYAAALESAGFAISEMYGFVWMPFPVTSNSKAVPFFASVEGVLRLNRWINQSPWLLIAATLK